MSHFPVLIIGDDIEEKLAPYDENIRVEPYIDIKRKEVLKKKKEIEREVNKASEKESKEKSYLQDYKNGKIEKMSLEEFAKSWYGQELDEEGNLLTTYNPDSKWDRHEIGGRWSGELLLKNGEKVNQSRFGEISWKGMLCDIEKAGHLSGHWDKTMNGQALYKPEHYRERYKTKRAFIERNMKFTTFAVITQDGRWHEKGEMGYWGMSSDTDKDAEKWGSEYWDRFLKDLKPDTLLTIVDCHI